MLFRSYSENTLKIGELGIGLNKKASLIGCTVVDEKLLDTCHFAIGSNYWFGGPIKSKIHLDQVLKKPKIFIEIFIFSWSVFVSLFLSLSL